MQAQERDSGRTIRELKTDRGTDNCLKEKIVNRLETAAVQKDKEIEKSMHNYHQLKTKYELLKAKMQDITSNMTSQVAYTIDELREELAQSRTGMAQMAEEHQNSMDDVKHIFTKVSRKMAENLDEVTQERDNFEDQVDQLKQRLRTSEDRLQRVIREKRENIEVLKSDFA